VNVEPDAVRRAVQDRLEDAKRFLKDLIAIPSLSGAEQGAMDFVAEAFGPLGRVDRVPLGEWIRQDEHFSDPIEGITYEGRSNVRVTLGGAGEAHSLIINTHVDVVPAGENQPHAFAPYERDGRIFGRGACDAKGQVAAIWLAMAALRRMSLELPGRLIVHLVVEEENGGNGTLAMIRRAPRLDRQAEGCIVMEPTELAVCPSVRGAVWFRVDCFARPGHPGRAGRDASALDKARRVMEIMQRYHDKLLDESRHVAMFEKFDDPMPLVIGSLHAGDWPAAAPAKAVMQGILGMLPNTDCRKVMEQLTEAIQTEAHLRRGEDFEIRFLYRHDPMVTPTAHPLVACLEASVTRAGVPCRIEALTASCDSWLYNNVLGIPTVVFGAGSLSCAHGDDEHLPIDQLAAAARALVHVFASWCARPHE